MLEQFQNKSAFEIQHGKTCPFPSQIRSSFSAFRDMFLHLGQSIQEWTKENLWKTAFKKFEYICSAIPSGFLKTVVHKFYLVLS